MEKDIVELKDEKALLFSQNTDYQRINIDLKQKLIIAETKLKEKDRDLTRL
jgi:hypothetical protein